ncbi:Sodium/hydrogen exchanger 8 [Nymphon striatum]|nr:Sodium/hydrogen exchanger 8 [Nymphon striatum]
MANTSKQGELSSVIITSTDIQPPYIILFIITSISVGAAIKIMLKKIRLPYTVILLILGCLFGFLSSKFKELQVYTTLSRADPHLILHIFLPVLLFESAFSLDVHTFIQSLTQVILLATFGMVISAVLTAILAKYLFALYNWNWLVSMLFGSILSATDPVAVVAVLKELGTSEKLTVMIEGESLLNDGSAIVMFNIILDLIKPEAEVNIGQIILSFARITIGGSLFGLIMGKISVVCLNNIFNDAIMEITVTLTAAYLTFYIAEVILNISSIIAVVILGLVINAQRMSISPEVEATLHLFWSTLAYLANTLIFVIVGITIMERASIYIQQTDWFYSLALFVGINIIRLLEVLEEEEIIDRKESAEGRTPNLPFSKSVNANPSCLSCNGLDPKGLMTTPKGVTITILSPLLRRLGYGLSWKFGVIMTWGGLRGAVGLCLALLVSQHNILLEDESIGNKMLVHCAGIVILTLCINATTIKSLLDVLGMSDISYQKRVNITDTLEFLNEQQYRSINTLKTDRFLADANWEMVHRSTLLKNPYQNFVEDEEIENLMNLDEEAYCVNSSPLKSHKPTDSEFEEMYNEARLRVNKTQKESYWKQYEHGLITRKSIKILMENNAGAADKQYGRMELDHLSKHWQVPMIYKYMPLLSRFIRMLDMRINKQLSTGYDVGRGFIVGEETAKRLIDRMVSDKTIADTLKIHSDQQKSKAIRELGHLQQMHPGVAMSVKTRQAIRSVLNNTRENIQDLRERGQLDENEYLNLRSLIEHRMKKLMNVPPSISPPSPQLLLNRIPWIAGNIKLIKYMMENSSIKCFNEGDVIAEKGSYPIGIDLIISGMIKLIRRNTQDFSSSVSLLYTELQEGQLPNTESFIFLDQNEYEDYIGSGNLIGEMGMLTSKPRNCSAICETSVQLDPIDPILDGQITDMKVFDAFNSSNQNNSPVQMDWTLERIQILLEDAIMPNIDKVTTFNILKSMSEVILIQGIALDGHTRELHYGPKVIPRSIRKLIFSENLNDATPKLIFIPSAEYISDFSFQWTRKERPRISSSRSIYHTGQKRKSISQRRREADFQDDVCQRE